MFRVAVLMTLAAAPAMAEPVDVKDARKMLFSPKGVDVVMKPDTGMSAKDLGILETVVKAQAETGGYYGAVAVAPGESLLTSEATVALMNYHSVEGASEAALAACEEKRTEDPACVIAAEILPRKFEEQPVTLSRDATEAFRDFRKGRDEKAFAISESTGEWAFFKGDNAAFAARNLCNEKAGGKGKADCETVIAD